MLYMVTFTINIPPMLAYIPYMDPMGQVGLQQFTEFFLTVPGWKKATLHGLKSPNSTTTNADEQFAI